MTETTARTYHTMESLRQMAQTDLRNVNRKELVDMLHVRFIAINDDFDNIRQSDVDSLAVPIKNMVNSLYAKDRMRTVCCGEMRT